MRRAATGCRRQRSRDKSGAAGRRGGLRPALLESGHNMTHNYYTQRAIEYWQSGAVNRQIVEGMIEAGGLADRVGQLGIDMVPAVSPGGYAHPVAYAADQVD